MSRRDHERADRPATEDRADISRTDDRADKTLPVTAEVGDEGGSYADPTMQVDTFSGPKGNDRMDPKRVQDVAKTSDAITAGTRKETGAADEVRHATDEPDRTG